MELIITDKGLSYLDQLHEGTPHESESKALDEIVLGFLSAHGPLSTEDPLYTEVGDTQGKRQALKRLFEDKYIDRVVDKPYVYVRPYHIPDGPSPEGSSISFHRDLAMKVVREVEDDPNIASARKASIVKDLLGRANYRDTRDLGARYLDKVWCDICKRWTDPKHGH